LKKELWAVAFWKVAVRKSKAPLAQQLRLSKTLLSLTSGVRSSSSSLFFQCCTERNCSLSLLMAAVEVALAGEGACR
jgi:hypothetical protein